jgi:hypothetical protein
MIARHSSARAVLSFLGLAALACTQRAPVDQAPPPTSGAPTAPGEVAAFGLALTTTPPDVRCARATVTTEAGDKVIRTFDASPGQTSNLTFGGVPPGLVKLFVETFNTSCATLSTTTPATWISQDPKEVDLRAGSFFFFTLTLRRPTMIDVGADFVDTNSQIVFNVSSFQSTPVVVGQQLESIAATLVNFSGAPFTPNFTFTGSGSAQEFFVGSTCSTNEICCATGKSIPNNGSCTLRVIFKPQFSGKREALLDAGSNVNLIVKGTGTFNGGVSLTPSSLDLGAVPAGPPSEHTFTLSNGGFAPFPTTFTLTGNPSEFQVRGGTCLGLGQVELGMSCTFIVGFTRAPTGVKNTVLNVGGLMNGVSANIHAVVVSPPAVTITPSVQNFGTVVTGQAADVTFTLANPTDLAVALATTMMITGPNAGEFGRVGGTCSTLLASQADCTVQVRFSPATAGAKTATLSVGPGLSTVALSGTGSGPLGSVTISPVGFNYGSVVLGQFSEATFSVNNTTASAFSFALGFSGGNPGDFSRQGGTCGTALPAMSSCTLGVRFAPQVVGPRGASFDIGGGVSAMLTGAGVAGQGATLTPTSLNFGSVGVGNVSAPTTFTLTNTGSTTLSFTVGMTGATPLDFPRSGGSCGSSLAAGASCTIGVIFEPNQTGARSATLTVSSGSLNLSAALTGTAVPGVSLSPASRDFGTVAVGQFSATQVFTLSNNSLSPFSFVVSSTGANPMDFPRLGGTCSGPLAAGASCTMNIIFEPNAVGVRSATLTVSNSLQAVTAALTGVAVSTLPAPITKLVINDSSAANAGSDGIPNNQQWSIQTNFRAGIAAFGDRTVTITSTGNGTLDGKSWIRTAADSKTFSGSPLATFTLTGQFLYLLVDDRLNTGSKPTWLDDTYTDMGFNAVITEGTNLRDYSVWRKSVVSGSTVTLPTINSSKAPCYIVVVE